MTNRWSNCADLKKKRSSLNILARTVVEIQRMVLVVGSAHGYAFANGAEIEREQVETKKKNKNFFCFVLRFQEDS